MKYLYLSIILSIAAITALSAPSVRLCARKKDMLTLVLDPGHGGTDSGASNDTADESDLNLQIAKALKDELENYADVKVLLTREDDTFIGLEDRTAFAREHEADFLISLHNNAISPTAPYDHGCTVLTACGRYDTDMADKEQKLAVNILYELENIGITDQGILLRDSQSGETYDDGSLADYYAIVRNGILQKVPSILIEHAFMDNPDDYEMFLSSEEKLRTLAKADARGIARFFRLKSKSKGRVLPSLKNRTETVLHQTGEGIDDYEESQKTFFPYRYDPLELFSLTGFSLDKKY